MSRIATIKETGLELSDEEWTRFEEAVAVSLFGGPEPWPFARRVKAAATDGPLSAFHRPGRESRDLCFDARSDQP